MNSFKGIVTTAIFLISVTCFAADPSLAKYLQDISVTIRTGKSEGSGVVFTRKNDKNENINFVWTAAHVVEELRSTRKVVSPEGEEKTIVEFKDAKVVKIIIEDGRTVGTLEFDAEVIRYSDADTGEDLALLRIRKKNFIENASAKFFLDKEIPSLGTELYHVGSLMGSEGANSMTSGIYSQQGRLISKTVFDQSTVIALPGSSGGGIFLKEGKNAGQYIGMLVRGTEEAFNLMVPIRRMNTWAKKAKVEWAINPDVNMPTEEEFEKLPVEDVGKDFKDYAKAGASRTFIKRLSPEKTAPKQ